MAKNSILFIVFEHPVFSYTLLYIEGRRCVSAQKGVTLNRRQMRAKCRYSGHKKAQSIKNVSVLEILTLFSLQCFIKLVTLQNKIF